MTLHADMSGQPTLGTSFLGTYGVFGQLENDVPLISLDMERSSSTSLSQTDDNFGAFNRRKFAVNFHVKRESVSGAQTHTLFAQQGGAGGDISILFRFLNDTIDVITSLNGIFFDGRVTTTDTYTSTSDWIHILFYFDIDNATAGDRMRLFVDGVEVALTTYTAPSDEVRDSSSSVYFGGNGPATAQYDGLIYNAAVFSGYLPRLEEVINTTTLAPKGILLVDGLYSHVNTRNGSIVEDYELPTDWTNNNSVGSSTDVP